MYIYGNYWIGLSNKFDKLLHQTHFVTSIKHSAIQNDIEKCTWKRFWKFHLKYFAKVSMVFLAWMLFVVMGSSCNKKGKIIINSKQTKIIVIAALFKIILIDTFASDFKGEIPYPLKGTGWAVSRLIPVHTWMWTVAVTSNTMCVSSPCAYSCFISELEIGKYVLIYHDSTYLGIAGIELTHIQEWYEYLCQLYRKGCSHL